MVHAIITMGPNRTNTTLNGAINGKAYFQHQPAVLVNRDALYSKTTTLHPPRNNQYALQACLWAGTFTRTPKSSELNSTENLWDGSKIKTTLLGSLSNTEFLYHALTKALDEISLNFLGESQGTGIDTADKNRWVKHRWISCSNLLLPFIIQVRVITVRQIILDVFGEKNRLWL